VEGDAVNDGVYEGRRRMNRPTYEKTRAAETAAQKLPGVASMRI